MTDSKKKTDYKRVHRDELRTGDTILWDGKNVTVGQIGLLLGMTVEVASGEHVFGTYFDLYIGDTS